MTVLLHMSIQLAARASHAGIETTSSGLPVRQTGNGPAVNFPTELE